LLDNIKGQFDVVLANLTADLLCQLTNNIQNNIHPNTVIIASGIINPKAAQVAQAFAKCNLFANNDNTIINGEWTAFCFGGLKNFNCKKCTQY